MNMQSLGDKETSSQQLILNLLEHPFSWKKVFFVVVVVGQQSCKNLYYSIACISLYFYASFSNPLREALMVGLLVLKMDH